MNHRRQAWTMRKRLVTDAHTGPAGRPHLVALPSTDPSLRFEAKLFVECRWTGAGAAPPSAWDIAAEGVSQRAEKLSRDHSLTQLQRVHGKLAIALLHWEEVEKTEISARAHCASVTADPELVSEVETREEAARRQIVISWQHEQREHTAARLRPLIVDPLRATAWWFADNQDKIDKLSEVAKEFQDLQARLGRAVDEDSTGLLVDEFLTAVDVPEQERLLMQLQRVFVDRGRDDLARRINLTSRNAAEVPGSN